MRQESQGTEGLWLFWLFWPLQSHWFLLGLMQDLRVIYAGIDDDAAIEVRLVFLPLTTEPQIAQISRIYPFQSV